MSEQRESNIHARDDISEDSFVEMRTTRDAMLSIPMLMPPAVQVNMRGRLPESEGNGIAHLRIPVDAL